MAGARFLLANWGGTKAQSVWLCRGGRESGRGQGTHDGTSPHAVAPQPAGRDQVHAHVAHPPRAVPAQAPIALRLTPSAVLLESFKAKELIVLDRAPTDFYKYACIYYSHCHCHSPHGREVVARFRFRADA